ncbi:MAG: hypothetical protein ACERLM_00975 [Acidimicrobiales bacterium]
MTPIDRRRFLLLTAMAGAAACSDDGDPEGAAGPSTSTPGSSTTAPGAGPSTTAAPPAELTSAPLAPPGTTGLMDEAAYQARIDDYLDFATATDDPSSPTGIAVHLIQAERDPDYTWNVDAVTVDSLQATWDRIDAWKDTRDFQLMYLTWLVALGQGDTPMTQLDPAVIKAIEQRFLANRYRYNDPLPDDRVDHLWYWSENHRIITLAIERLAGELYPDAVFEVTGMTGAEHAERAKPDILEWIDERARFGFFEWHSNVYMVKNITPLLMLAELSSDPEIVQASALALDLALFDMASHYHRGAYVAPHGRTYKKDKMTAGDEDTYGTAKLLFDRTDAPYQSPTDTGATYFGAAQRYRPPQLVIDVARDEQTSVTRERHGVFVDASEPLTENPEAPFGYDFDDPANIPFWWSTGGIGMWQLARASVAEADKYRLWEGDVFQPITQLRDVNDGDVESIRAWEQANYMILNFGFLAEGNTYAWRHPKVSLASVVDHRKGEMRDQGHAWDATIDTEARVFTNHPMTDADESTEWRDDPDPGYWTGEASMPRSAQIDNTAIHLYLPAYDETQDPVLALVFRYLDYTHAYFPQDHFDEVRQVGHWTLGAKDGGHIALWSSREPTWRVYDPAVHATNGMEQPFDLQALGGPDNAWVVEVGTDEDGTFDEFVAAITAADPAVERTDDGLTVAWKSPTNGELSFGWDEPFVVNGEEQEITDFPRHESPWGQVDRLAKQYRWSAADSVLELDFDAGTRTFS